MAHIKKKHFYLLATLLILLTTLVLFLVFRKSSTPLTGALRTQTGIKNDGVYDIKLVGYNKQSGAQVIDQSFDNVPVADGQYAVPISVKRFSENGNVVVQSCYKADPEKSNSPNDLDCKDTTNQEVIIDCARDYSLVGSNDILSKVTGNKELVSTGSCAPNEETKDLGLASSNLPATVLAMGPQGATGSQGIQGDKGEKGDKGDAGEPGTAGADGANGQNGAPGVQGPAGDPASDDQTLNFNGISLLSISGGNSVDLSTINTDLLASISCSVGQILQYNGSAWACASPAASSDSQTLSLVTNTLSISNGNSVSLASYLDNTDAQSISVASNILSISGSVSTVNLAPYLDNTDAQSLGYTPATHILSISGNASTVDLSGLLDNTDSQSISKTANTLSISGNASTVDLSGYLDNTDSQSISLVGNTLNISGSAGTVNLAPYLDNTDVLAGLSCSSGQIAKFNGSAWACATDSGLTSETDGVIGNEVIDATVSGGLTRSGSGTTIDPYTLGIALGGVTNAMLGNSSVTVTAGTGLSGGGSVALGSTVTLSSTLGTDINSAEIVDGTITATDIASGTITFANIAGNSCTNGQIFKYNGSAWVCGTDNDTDTTYSAGTGISFAGTVISSTLGTSIDSSEIVDGTIANSDLASDSVTSTKILDGTIATADIATSAITSSLIADGTVANADLVNSAVTVTAGTGLSGGGSVALGSSVTLTSTLGTAIDTSEITDGTILFSDLAQNSCGLNQIIKWNGSVWACASDSDTSQNVFTTVATPDSNNPSADSASDTLTLANGAGIDITSNGTTDTITIAATLGTAIDSSEITDGTITSSDISGSAGITNSQLANSSVTVTAGTGLSGGGSVALGSSVTLNSLLGTAIDSTEITDGTVATVDLADGSVTLGKLASCSTDGQILKYYSTDPDGAGSLTAGWNCTGDQDTTYSAGTGIGIAGTTISSTLGTDINSAEIVDGTITSTDISATANIANSQLANSAVTVTAGTGLSGGGAVSLGGTVTLNSTLGTAIDSSEITDATITGTDIASATIQFSNIAQNGCGTNQIMKWNGSAWACSTDLTGGVVNSFETITTSSGTSPVADSSTDTLTLSAGSGVTITGDGTTDTITVAATLGTDITSAEIVDGTIVNADLANSSVTVTAGTGLSGGGAVSLGGTVTLSSSLGTDIDSSEIVNGTIVSADLSATAGITNGQLANSNVTVSAGNGLNSGGSVSLGGTTTLNIGAGNGITVNADDIAVATAASADGLSSTTSSGSGIEALASGIALLQGCSDNQILKWNETTDVWACANDIDTNTDAQTLSLVTNSLSISGGNSVSLAGYLDNTDSQSISVASNILSISGSASTVSLVPYLDNTDSQNLSYVAGTQALSIGGGNTVSLSNLLDNTDSQDLTLTGNTLALTGDGTSVDLSGYLDNTDNQNLFLTINTDNGTGPVADSSTDTLNLVSGSGVTITGDGTTDTITVASTLGTDITSAEIVDGTITTSDISATAGITNAQLANSSVTLTAGNGLTTGGAVSLGGSVTLDIGAGNGITVNANDIAVRTATSADGLSSTTSSGSGIEVLSTGIALLQGCANNEILKWNETSDVWACATDIGAGAEVDGVIGNEVTDATASGGLIRSGSGTTIDPYTLAITTGGVTNSMLTNSSVTLTAGSGLTTGGSVSLGGSVTLDIGAGNGITVNANDIAVRTATSADALSSTTSSGSGIEVLASGVALLQGCSDGQILKWNETTDVWACSADNDTILSEATIESYIFDADNTGTLSSGTLALGSLSYTGTLTDTNISDTLTIGATSTVSDSALSANVSLLGANIAGTEVVADTLDYTEINDNPTLDATTTTSLGANNLITNLNSTGDYLVQDNGTTVLSVLDNGTFLFQNSANNANSFVVNNAGALPFLDIDTSANSVNIGTLVDDAADVLLVLDGVSGAGDPTGIAGGMYYNTTNNKFRCYENGAWANCIQSGYSINVQALTSSPADAATVYFGMLPKAPVTVAATSKVYIPKTGTIKRAEIYVYSGTAGTAENWSLYVRKNNTTDSLIATVGAATAERVFTNSAINVAVTAGDYIEIKGVQPTWATNPLTTIYGGYIYIE